MKKLLSLVLVFVMLFTACGKTAADGWQEQYDLGMRYLTEGNYEEAILAFTMAIEINPKNIESYIGRGDAYVLWGETVQDLKTEKAGLALSDFLKAIELGDKNSQTFMKAANMYVCLDDIDGAIQILWKGYRITQDIELSNRAEVLGLPDEITVLTKQTDYEKQIYTAEGIMGRDGIDGYRIYEYDENGYLLHQESWQYIDRNGFNKWVKREYEDWIFSEENGEWTRYSYYLNIEQDKYDSFAEALINAEEWECMVSEDMESYPGTNYWGHSENLDPFPNGTPQTVEKSDSTVKYTYDENGNAILIEEYTKDGQLEYYCECEWATINISHLKYKMY